MLWHMTMLWQSDQTGCNYDMHTRPILSGVQDTGRSVERVEA